MNIIFGIFIPFLGTSLGAAMVIFMKNKLNLKLENILLGFASGVMIAASIWSLILPSMELYSQDQKLSWIPVTVGFSIGILSLLLIDKVVKKIEIQGHNNSRIKDVLMMIIAVTIHNIPEGLAVGVAFAGVISPNSTITYIQALILSIGVAIQNFPEGAIISLPLRNEGYNRRKAFLFGVLSGEVEPIAALITIILTSIIVPFLPYFLSFAAGAMFYVVINELIPETNKNDGILGTIGFTIGFLIMMILDVMLG